MGSDELLAVYKISEKSEIRLTRTEYNGDKWWNLRYWAYARNRKTNEYRWVPNRKKGIGILEKYAEPFFKEFMKGKDKQ